MGASRVYVVGSPYNAIELAEIDYEQTADTMYLAHIDHDPCKLVRRGHTDWEFITVTFGPALDAPTSCSAVATVANMDEENDGNNYFAQPATYCITAVDEDGKESRASNQSTCTNDLTLKRNYNTITWVAVTGAERYNIYKADNSQFFGYIGQTEDLTFRDDNIGPALDRAPPEAYNPFETTDDRPSTVTLFEQRSMWGRTRNAPNAVWGSRSGELENLDRSKPLRADDSLSFTVIAGKVNSINSLVSTGGLLALTSDSICTVDGDGSGGILTGNSPPAVRKQVGRGSARLSPLVIDNVVFYAPSVGISVRTLNYSFEIDGLKSNDVSIFSPHFFEGRSIVSWCFAQEPRALILAARDDGKVLCFTWEQEQNVWGWTMWETDGQVKSLCSISEDGEDRVYMLVDRLVDGETKRYVERLVSHSWDAVEDTCFLDCAVSGSFEEPQTEFHGLWHLEGRTDVAAIVDGVALTGLTVTGGTLQLPSGKPTGSVISVGIPYEVHVETLPVRSVMPGIGANHGRRQQTGDIILTVQDTRQILAGIDEDHLFPVKSRIDEPYGDADYLMNGNYEISSDGKTSDEICVYVKQVAPLPFTLLGIGRDLIIGG